jgi:hypothetical protein
MVYFEADRDYVILWPTIAISLTGEFWIELDWLNFVLGWRTGDDGGHGSHDRVEKILNY